MKPRKLIYILIPLVCFAFSPQMQAVVPPPDGGYPGFNTAEGTKALQSLSTGVANSGLGWYSLFTDSTASYNTGVGAGTLALNNADENTATGAGALFLNTSGTGNTANGAFALLSNDTGVANSASGDRALFSNTDGDSNTAVGSQALFANTIGHQNTGTGDRALFNNTEGLRNTANGFAALNNNTIGSDNTGIGSQALIINTQGEHNTAVGGEALFFNSTGSSNTAIGASALQANTTGSQNTGNGYQALQANTTGTTNTANGYQALRRNTTGIGNTANGYQTLYNNTTGDGNIALGFGAGTDVTTANDVIVIGTGAAGANVSNSCFISNIFGATSSGGAGVFVNAAGQLGTTTSSRRFKEQIKPMEQASEALLALKPVIFRYKKEIDPAGKSQFGLVAEEVEKVNPDLVVRDKEGKPYSVRYDQVNAMLLNEFLKEHKKVLSLETQLAQQQKEFGSKLSRQEKQIESLSAGLQKISAQLETSRPDPQIAANP